MASEKKVTFDDTSNYEENVIKKYFKRHNIEYEEDYHNINCLYKMIEYGNCGIDETDNKQLFVKGIYLHTIKDYVKAKKCFEMAIERGNIQAINNLGYMYHFELGVEKDLNKAKEYYEIGVSNGDSMAMTNLGYMYHFGQGVEQDIKKAKEYYEMAIKKSNSLALNNLGYIYNYCKNEQNYKKAFECYDASANKGNKYASYNLGHMYKFGIGVEKDLTKANEYFEMAKIHVKN